jgi:dephospho-CoA kinase
MRRIIITGPSCSGKTTLASHLAEGFGLPIISADDTEAWAKYRKSEDYGKILGSDNPNVKNKWLDYCNEAVEETFVYAQPKDAILEGAQFLPYILVNIPTFVSEIIVMDADELTCVLRYLESKRKKEGPFGVAGLVDRAIKGQLIYRIWEPYIGLIKANKKPEFQELVRFWKA